MTGPSEPPPAPPPPREPTVYRSGDVPRRGATYGAGRRGPGALLPVAAGVLILGMGTGLVFALQSLSRPADPVISTSFGAAGSTGPTSAPGPSARAAPTPASSAPASSAPRSSAPASSAPPPSAVLRGAGSQLCLDVAPDEPGAGGRVIVTRCGATPTQRWQVTGAGALVNAATGLCVSVAGATVDEGGRVQQEPCSGATSQQWRLAPAPDGTTALVAVHSGRCLDVTGGGTAPGTPLQQYGCNDTPAQRWAVVPAA